MVAVTPQSPYALRLSPLAAWRLLAAFLALVVVGSLALAMAAGAHRARSGTVSLDGAGPSAALPMQRVSSPVHVVQPGDTLWSIARAFQPEGDVRPLVSRLSRSVGGAPLQPGQRVTMPT